MFKRKRLNLASKSPYLILLGGFAILILLGSLLFMLPFATKQGESISYIDSLFLSTSSICVTGLVSTPQSLANLLTPFGSIVLWFLIEIGGLGFITLVTFAFSFTGRKAGVSTNVLLKEAMNQNSFQELIPLAKKIVTTSFLIQGIGFILNIAGFMLSDFNFFEALWMSFFHTASSFNNAGFDILGNSSLIAYKDNALLMVTNATLITLGGLGFVVMFDILNKKKWKRLSVHSKIVIKMTVIILVVGTLLLKLSAFNQLSWVDALLQIIFARTAGFCTIDLKILSYTPLIILCVVMFIGGSPASIAGGVKTTTIYTIAKSVLSFGRGKSHVISHNREIRQDLILKSYVLVTISMIFIGFNILMITISQPELALKDIAFEAISAFATCGTSLGITSELSSLSKIFIIMLMYFGRLGPITFISLLNKGMASEEKVRYIEEKIIIG